MKKSTEIYVNLMLFDDTPDEVLQVLYDLCELNMGKSLCLGEYDKYWGLFTNNSFNVPCTETKVFNYYNGSYSLLGKGDTDDKTLIVEFFKFISQYSATEFMGYYLGEDEVEPTLVYKKDFQG